MIKNNSLVSNLRKKRPKIYVHEEKKMRAVLRLENTMRQR